MSLYDVAFQLKLPLYKLVNEMSHEELLGWFAYFDKQPPGWREDHRTAMLMQSMGSKAKPSDLFASLKHMEDLRSEESAAASIKSSMFFTKMLSAVGGDSIKDML